MSAHNPESALSGISLVPPVTTSEPEVRTAMRVRKRNGSFEAVENPLLRRNGDTHSMIRDDQARPISPYIHVDRDRLTLSVLDGVGHQVENGRFDG